MNIAIDIRPLMDKQLTGVGEYTLNLLSNLFTKDSQNQYYLFYNSFSKIEVPQFNFPNVQYCQFKIPNKLLTLSLLLFKNPKLDKLIFKKYQTRMDLFFFPNICFQKTNCPYIITAHDLSYEIFPQFLTWKRKLWHKLINPKKVFQNAKQIMAVSNNTKQDLINKYQIASDKIQVIYSGIKQNFKVLKAADTKLKKIML